jgi:hypothetical protein
MNRTLLTILASASLAAAPAFAQFEGQIDMKITAQGGVTGTGKVFVSKAGSRTEMDMESARMPIHMTTLMRFATPDVLYLINDKAKTYSEMDIKKTREQVAKMAGAKNKEAYSAKVIGSERLLGYSTKHVFLSRPSDKSEMEVWTTKDLLGLSYETMRGLMRRGAGDDDGSMMKALKDAGAEGFFVKMVTREKGKTEPLTTMELTKAEKKSLPASMFEVPAGYAKQEGMMGAAGVMSPEAAEQMKKAMEGMTPEQRKQMEEMMKQQRQKN